MKLTAMKVAPLSAGVVHSCILPLSRGPTLLCLQSRARLEMAWTWARANETYFSSASHLIPFSLSTSPSITGWAYKSFLLCRLMKGWDSLDALNKCLCSMNSVSWNLVVTRKLWLNFLFWISTFRQSSAASIFTPFLFSYFVYFFTSLAIFSKLF
jgi:hypothetical protein